MRNLIDCNNFGCLNILEDLVEDKLNSEITTSNITEIADNIVGLNYYFKVYDKIHNTKDFKLKRNYFTKRIKSHVSQLVHYFGTDEVLMR